MFRWKLLYWQYSQFGNPFPSTSAWRWWKFYEKRLPVELIYFEEYSRIDEAFYREKQVQHWSRKTKEALIEGKYPYLPELAKKYGRRKHEPRLDTRFALFSDRGRWYKVWRLSRLPHLDTRFALLGDR